jgi:hypothetical protein
VEILGRVVRPNAESVAAFAYDCVRPVIHAEVPITDVARACELPDGPETVGKVVLRIR